MSKQENKVSKTDESLAPELYHGRVTYKLIPRPIVYGVDNSEKHILSKGMLDGANLKFQVLRDENGIYKLGLTAAEKAWIIEEMGLSKDDLNTAKRTNPFLDELSVTLVKEGLTFDLSQPMQMLHDGLLKAYTNFICPNLASVTHKRTYRYVRTTEDEIEDAELASSSVNKRMYRELDKVEGDRYKMIITLLNSGAKVPKGITEKKLRQRVTNLAEGTPHKFLEIVADPNFKIKGTLHMGGIVGAIHIRNRAYYFDNVPLAAEGQLADLPTAIEFLKQPVNKDVLLAVTKQITDEFGRA